MRRVKEAFHYANKTLRQVFATLLIISTGIIVTLFLYEYDEALMSAWIIIFSLGTIYCVTIYSIAIEKSEEHTFWWRIRDSIPDASKKFLLAMAILVCGGITLVAWNESAVTSANNNSNAADYLPTRVATLPETITTDLRSATVPTYQDNDYKYNYRTGSSGGYGYNYDVEGYSDSGDYFYGNVDTQDKYGDGYIYDEEGNEVYVQTEWVDYGVMEAYDDYGNSYEFEVH